MFIGTLKAAETKAIEATPSNPKSGYPHGKIMREVLRSNEKENAIPSRPDFACAEIS